MKILITGGTGFVGSALADYLLTEGHQVTLTSRRKPPGSQDRTGLSHLFADTSNRGEWQDVVQAQDVLVNLAGRSIFHLWSKQYKREIRNSRILTTRNLVEALADNSNAVMLNASAAGFYGDGGEHEKDESAPSGDGFLAEVCREWEAEAKKAEGKGARVAIMRFGVILGSGGGAIATMKTPFKMGLGGAIGNGNQWFPWIHIDDLVQAFLFLLSDNDCRGPFNFVAPGLVRQKEFAAALGQSLHRPTVIPAPAWVMKLALGEFGESLLQGQKAIPKALLHQGYSFLHPKLGPALQEIIGG